jgi:hypothetical protein
MRRISIKIGLITFLIFGGMSMTFAHPIHVTIINMDVKADGRLVFSVKLFVDDFQTVLNKHNQSNFILNASINLSEIKLGVTNYIFDKLKFGSSPEIKKEAYVLNDIKINDDSIWLYFEIDATAVDELLINNSLMCDLFDDQSNLLILNAGAEDMAYRFTNKERQFLFKLKP